MSSAGKNQFLKLFPINLLAEGILQNYTDQQLQKNQDKRNKEARMESYTLLTAERRVVPRFKIKIEKLDRAILARNCKLLALILSVSPWCQRNENNEEKNWRFALLGRHNHVTPLHCLDRRINHENCFTRRRKPICELSFSGLIWRSFLICRGGHAAT